MTAALRSPGTVSVIQTCTGGAAQRYAVTAAATSGLFTVRNVSSNHCLTVQGASAASERRSRKKPAQAAPTSNGRFEIWATVAWQ